MFKYGVETIFAGKLVGKVNYGIKVLTPGTHHAITIMPNGVTHTGFNDGSHDGFRKFVEENTAYLETLLTPGLSSVKVRGVWSGPDSTYYDRHKHPEFACFQMHNDLFFVNSIELYERGTLSAVTVNPQMLDMMLGIFAPDELFIAPFYANFDVDYNNEDHIGHLYDDLRGVTKEIIRVDPDMLDFFEIAGKGYGILCQPLDAPVNQVRNLTFEMVYGD